MNISIVKRYMDVTRHIEMTVESDHYSPVLYRISTYHVVDGSETATRVFDNFTEASEYFDSAIG